MFLFRRTASSARQLTGPSPCTKANPEKDMGMVMGDEVEADVAVEGGGVEAKMAVTAGLDRAGAAVGEVAEAEAAEAEAAEAEAELPGAIQNGERRNLPGVLRKNSLT